MALRVSTFFDILILLLPFVAANHWNPKRHQDVAHRARGDVDIHKRQSFTSARFTYYAVGLGACGQYNQPNDWIVALNVPQYGDGYPGPQCFKSITIQYGGKTAVAMIMDECEACPYGGLDFSEGLFSYFSDLSAGVLYGTWWFNDGSGGGGGGGGGGDTTTTSWTPTTTWQEPTTTSTPDYTPPPTSSTPDYTPTTTPSSTPAYTPTTTSTMSTTSSSSSTATTPSSSSSSTTSYNPSTGQASGLAVPTGGVVSTPDTSNPQNILVINEIMIEVGLMLSAEKHE